VSSQHAPDAPLHDAAVAHELDQSHRAEREIVDVSIPATSQRHRRERRTKREFRQRMCSRLMRLRLCVRAECVHATAAKNQDRMTIAHVIRERTIQTLWALLSFG
jgi:hypothetical protein